MDISPAAKVFWFKVMYIGILALPTFFLLFVITFTHHDAWLTRRKHPALCSAPSRLLYNGRMNFITFYSSFTAIQEQDFFTLEIMLVRATSAISSIPMYRGIGFLLLSQGRCVRVLCISINIVYS
jgi:hypothetical protein